MPPVPVVGPVTVPNSSRETVPFTGQLNTPVVTILGRIFASDNDNYVRLARPGRPVRTSSLHGDSSACYTPRIQNDRTGQPALVLLCREGHTGRRDDRRPMPPLNLGVRKCRGSRANPPRRSPGPSAPPQ